MLLEKWWMPHMFSSCLVTGRGDRSSTDISSTPQVSTAAEIEVVKKKTHRPKEVVIVEDKSCSDSDVSIGVPPLAPQQLPDLDHEATHTGSPYDDLQASSSEADDPDWEQSLKPPATLPAKQDVVSIPIGDKGTQWHVDLLGPLQLGSRGERFVVMAIDSFTKYPEAAAIKTKTPGEVEEFSFRDVVCRYNVCEVVTDHGTEFEGDFDAMCTDLGLMRKQTSPHHIPSLMVKERMNSLKHALRTLCNEHPSTWPYMIPKVLRSYRDEVHRSSILSPAESMIGEKLPSLGHEAIAWEPYVSPSTTEQPTPQGIGWYGQRGEAFLLCKGQKA